MLWVHSPAVDGCSTNRLLEVRILSAQPHSRVSASRNMCSRGCHGRRIRRSNAADRIKGGSRAVFRALRNAELAVDQAYLKWRLRVLELLCERHRLIDETELAHDR